jgi:ribosomal-protein-alanine N-acetyltransferase
MSDADDVSRARPYGVRRVTRTEDGSGIDALAEVCFAGDTFSLAEELGRPWARIWSAFVPPPMSTPDGTADTEERFESDAPSGFLLAWHVADELHVLNVATSPPMRRRGVARALMDEALVYARRERIRVLLLEVRRSNRPAIKLYRAYGFTAFGVRRGYYADNDEDAVEMILALDPESGRVVPSRDEIRIDG